MSATLVPSKTTAVVRLVDDPNVQEVYADNFVGLSFTNGNMNLTFAAVRADHSQSPSPNFRQVVGRLVLPASVAIELHALLGQILSDMETKGMIKKGPTLSVVQ